MKSFLVGKLIENSKTTKSVPGELAKPGYDDLGTPNNHTTGKKTREVDGKKNLGGYPTGAKKVSQVQPPKAKERRSMVENSVVDMIMGFMMKMSGPKFGRQLYDQLKQEEPELYKRLVDKFTALVSHGNITDRQMMAKLQADPDALDLAQQIQAWVGDRLPPEFDAWADKKRTQLGMGESLKLPKVKESIDNSNTDAVPVTSKAKNKDEGLKKPPVAKTGAVARDSRIGTIGDNKELNADIGTIRKLPAGYQGGEAVSVAKIKEDLGELYDMLGGLTLDPDVMQEVFENYPDDMSWSRFDNYMGDGSEDDEYEGVISAIKEAASRAIEEYSSDFVDAYLSSHDEDHLHDFYNHVMDAASEGEPSNDFYDVDYHKSVDELIVAHLTSKGVPADVIKRVLPVSSKVTESNPCWTGTPKKKVSEAHGTSPAYLAYSRAIDAVKSLADFKIAGSRETLWDVLMQDQRITHNERDELQAAYDRKKRELTQGGIQRSAKKMADHLFGENASMGAVGSGSIPATTAAGGKRHRSQLFADAPGGREPDGIDFVPQNPRAYIQAVDAYMEPTHGMSWADLDADIVQIQKAIKAGMTPKEFADGIAKHMGLTEDEVDEPISYLDYATMLRGRGWRSGGGEKSQYHDNATAMRFFGQGPNKAALDVYVRGDNALNSSPVLGWYIWDAPYEHRGRGRGYNQLMAKLDALSGKTTEMAHDMMPRKTQHVDRAKAAGMKDADEILDPSSVPEIGGNGDPKLESRRPVSRYK